VVILVNPMWSVEHLNKDSNYVHIKKVVENYTKLYPDTYFIIPFPIKHFKYFEDGFFDNPKVERIPYKIPLAKKINNITFDGEWYKDVIEKYNIAIVYNQIPEVTGQLKCIDTHFQSNISVVNQHHYIYHDSLPYTLEGQMQYVYWQILGDVLADENIFNSKYTMWMVEDNVKKYMPDFTDKIKGTVVPFGLYNPEDVIKNKKFDKFTFVYNHRLQAYKNWEVTFDMFDDLYKDYDFDVAVCPVGTSNLVTVNKKPYTKIYECKTQKQYYDVLSKCHANTFNSQYETFCISIFESMMQGLATIVPEATTMPELLGSGNEQLFRDKDEQLNLVRRMLENPNLAIGWGEHNSQRAKTFSVENYCKRLRAIFTQQLTKKNMFESLKDKNKEKLMKFLDKFDTIKASELKRIRRHINLSNQSVPNHRLVNIMYHAGYDQIIKKDEPIFVKQLDTKI